MQEFSQRVCQYVEAFENEQKKKYKMSLQKTEASAGTAYILFEESQLQLMFYVFEVAIVVPLFSFFRHFSMIFANFLVYTVLQRSFFFFARVSCSEQSTFHGQASDRVWSFPNCSFKASRRKKRKKKEKKEKEKK